MFDNNVFIDNSCVNVVENGKVIGYEMETNITYYRGIPLSMVENIRVEVDGKEEPSESIRISTDKTDWFTLKEAETVTSYKWEYGEPLYIRILKENGLNKGKHKVKLTVATRTAYIPVPLEGNKERTVAIG
ncbi:C-glycoside deglycosidase beta subunit domain-containing protein [Clostridium nigeriense]|uniref:C-glycoside deglycosidase beta subunit domain-containing protein n=1 Tax=Clostridium nigeriense TaxID=1805470 RepID=UPI003D34CDA1